MNTPARPIRYERLLRISTCYDLKAIKKEVYVGIEECGQRGLLLGAKWLSEILLALDDVPLVPPKVNYDCRDEVDAFYAGKCFFDTGEYGRCALITQTCCQASTRFLHYYARFMRNQMLRKENRKARSSKNSRKHRIPDPLMRLPLKELREDMKELHAVQGLDGYELYLYGVVLKRLGMDAVAINVLIEAVHAKPINWLAWNELMPMIHTKETLLNLNLPDHWLAQLFIAEVFLALYSNVEALEVLNDLVKSGFDKSRHIIGQIAIARHNLKAIAKGVPPKIKMQDA